VRRRAKSPLEEYRKVALAAAIGGASLGVAGAGTWGLIKAESLVTRRRIPPAEDDPPRADGVWRAKGVSRK